MSALRQLPTCWGARCAKCGAVVGSGFPSESAAHRAEARHARYCRPALASRAGVDR